MTSIEAPSRQRTDRIERVAAELLPRASQLTRLVIRQLRGEISRTEGAILGTLATGPQRITDLAELEGLAQPTMTLLIKRLEQRGWVIRGREAGDGRVALISLTATGAEALRAFRADYRAVLGRRLSAMSDERLAELETAAVALGALIEDLQRGSLR